MAKKRNKTLLLRPAFACLLPAAGWISATVHAQESDRLVALINQYRASPQRCDGADLPPARRLAPDRLLEQVRLSQGEALQQALKDAGYQAARAEAIVLSGPRGPSSVMTAIRERYCRSILRNEYSAIGVSRSGNTWRVVLAQPLLSPDMAGPFAAGRQVLALVNSARAKPRTCGGQRFPSAPPLTWSEPLAQASLAHSRDMADRNDFRHEGKDGRQVGDRARQAGYRWRHIGENIAAGQGSAQQVVSGWLSSPGHCANIMDGNFREMGAAYAVNPKSEASIYWTQVFGRPR